MRWREEQGTQSKGIDNQTVRKFCPGPSKGQLISKGLFKVFICTKNEQKYFCISALAYKKRSNQKSSVRESK